MSFHEDAIRSMHSQMMNMLAGIDPDRLHNPQFADREVLAMFDEATRRARNQWVEMNKAPEAVIKRRMSVFKEGWNDFY